MRITYRNQNIKDYWLKRWNDIPSDKPMLNTDIYPLKFSEMVVNNLDDQILEAGCGAGRILRFYHEKGYKIIGIDYIDVAIKKLKDIDDTLNIFTSDITNLNFKDKSFDTVLAFGLYHNLEKNLLDAISETNRVLKVGGKVCASFRADNVQTKLVDWFASRKGVKEKQTRRIFHKMNLTKKEFINLFEKQGFKVDSVYPVENMPILYKFKLFRSKSHKLFDENKARAEGYKLSKLGNLIQKFLMKFFSDQFCNIYVLIAKKL